MEKRSIQYVEDMYWALHIQKGPEEESGCYALYAGIQECSFALAKLGRNNIHKKQAQTTDKASKHAVSRELQLVFSS
jgi:hypothetical protein